MGKVYLVGAGPGNSELITVRGLELLRKCDTVIYDSLSGLGLLEEVPDTAEQIYVGKRAGSHSRSQDEINEILVQKGSNPGIVVRLKGGDPFVFGRGGEEIEALAQHGIDYEVVPGVTSAVAVPELAGIPVTHREVSRSFHVYTAHTKEGIAQLDYKTMAKLSGTQVFLMGLSALDNIAQGLIEAGKPKATPAAVISSGSLNNQRVVRGCLSDISKRAAEYGMTTPAIIVVGDTAQLDYTAKANYTVGITATKKLYERMKNLLAQRGIDAKCVCSMQIEKDSKALAKLSKSLDYISNFSWIIFTSQNAVDIFFELVKEKQMDMREFADIRFAAVGSASSKRLMLYGFKADFVPSVYNAQALSHEFAKMYNENTENGTEENGPKVLIPRAKRGSKALTDILADYKISYEEYAIYDVKGIKNVDFKEAHFDCLAFSSSSGVDALFENMTDDEKAAASLIPYACIGDATVNRLKQVLPDCSVAAKEMSTEALVNQIRSNCNG